MSSKIHDLRAREMLDSRGNPTLEVDVILESAALGRPQFRPAPLPDVTRLSSGEMATRTGSAVRACSTWLWPSSRRFARR